MDVVIPLGGGSKWRNNELRYALRSIEKNLSGYDKIFIIGECPEWVYCNVVSYTETKCGLLYSCNNEGVIHIPQKDTPGRKEFSIWSKIMKAVNSEICSKDFLFTNDDIFFIKPIHTGAIQYYYEGTLQEKYERSHGHYKAAIGNVINVSQGTNIYADIHTPIIYNKELFKERTSVMWEKEYVIKSLYSGYETHNTAFMTDCKINKIMTEDEILGKIHGRYFFSIGPYGVCPAMNKVLNKLFPNKSRYEK